MLRISQPAAVVDPQQMMCFHAGNPCFPVSHPPFLHHSRLSVTMVGEKNRKETHETHMILSCCWKVLYVYLIPSWTPNFTGNMDTHSSLAPS